MSSVWSLLYLLNRLNVKTPVRSIVVGTQFMGRMKALGYAE